MITKAYLFKKIERIDADAKMQTEQTFSVEGHNPEFTLAHNSEILVWQLENLIRAVLVVGEIILRNQKDE